MLHYGKLDTNDTIAEIVTSDTRINDGEHVFLSAEEGFDRSSYIGRKWARPSVTWRAVSRRQARQQLLADGLLSQLESAIDGIADETQREMTRIWYQDADPWERDNAELNTLADQLGLTGDQVDTMFREASKR